MTTKERKSLNQLPLTTLKGVGDKMAEKLSKLKINNLQDLLFHLPFRYQDRTQITPLGRVRPMQDVVVQGEIKNANIVFGRRRSLVVRINDGTGFMSLRFFHFSAAQKNYLKDGALIRAYGEARPGKSGLELYHPEYQIIESFDDAPNEETLTPVYPATEGISQAKIRDLCEQAVRFVSEQSDFQEYLPQPLLQHYQFMNLMDAVVYLHTPPKDADQLQLLEGEHPAQQRLAFEELVAHNLSLQKLRAKQQQDPAPAAKGNGKLEKAFLAQLPFNPTNAQQRVSAEILADLAKPVPMLRLVQGDVGSGKTLVAAMAAIAAVESGYQVAIMAPTEILAEQHYLNFSQWLNPLGVNVGWLAGKTKAKEKNQTLMELANGEIQIVVGTHALIQPDVHYQKLALAIIDEQHRFGVDQRLALKSKGLIAGWVPHQLIMTATPIPRTLAMSAYADLDYSVIDELPPGRTPVNTVALSQVKREAVIERIRLACQEGKQAYWVCTLIEESEALECQAAEATAEELKAAMPESKVALVHGRMKPQEKQTIMDAFKAGQYQLLVATTVIEVGVDVPNASLMVIENPERLGLAQLHQLRGRVGRGKIESHCILLFSTPLSETSKQRIQAMRDTNDGFKIAELDLEIRGPGEVLGTKQTGAVNFKIADLERDGHWLDEVKKAAQLIQQTSPESIEPLIQRWVTDAERYGSV